MTPFTTLLDTTETPLRKRRGVFVTQRKLGCMAVSALILIISLMTVAYHFMCLRNPAYDAKEIPESNQTFQNCCDSTTPQPWREELQGDSEIKKDTPEKQVPALLYQVQPPIFDEIKENLAASFKPLHYTLRLIPILSGNFSVRGTVEIAFEAMANLSSVTLHSKRIIIQAHSVKIKRKDGTQLKILKQYEEQDFYVMAIESDLVEGFQYNISMDFESILGRDGIGFYHSSYLDEFNIERRFAATHLWPNYARTLFPCFDEPSLLANFTIQVARKRHGRVLSNVPRKITEPVLGTYGYYWDVFEETPALAPYSVAIVVSEFVSSPKEASFKVWSRGSFAGYVKKSLEEGRKALKVFEEYFGSAFPFKKLDVALLPDLRERSHGGPGLVTLRESDMLYHPLISSSDSHFKLLKQMRNSISRQWLGSFLSPTVWSQNWIVEAFATYLEYSSQDVAGDVGSLTESFQEVLLLDSFSLAHPVDVQLASAEVNRDLMASLVAVKGAAILRMFEHLTSKDFLREALLGYSQRRPNKDRDEQGGLWRLLTSQAEGKGLQLPDEAPLEQILLTWTLQPGYPLLHLSKVNGSYFASQEKFSEKNPGRRSPHTLAHRTRWFIPVTYATQSNPDFSGTKPLAWVTPSDGMQWVANVSNDGWFIFNLKRSAFCRVNYDHENWMAIIYQLKTDHTVIDTENRAQLLDDSAALARAGLLSYDVMLTLYSYLKYEEEFLPWQAALKNLNHLLQMFSGTPAHQSLRVFVLSRVTNIYNKNLREKHEGGLAHKRFRAFVKEAACSLQEKHCLEMALISFKKWMADDSKDYASVSPDERSSVFCTGIAMGSVAEWNILWSRYRSSEISPLQRDMLRALGCSSDKETLKRFLKKTISEEEKLSRDDIVAIFEGIANRHSATKVAWHFVRKHLRQILVRLRHDLSALDQIINAVTSFMNTQQYLNELKNLRKDYSKYSAAKMSSIDLCLERANLNLRWKKQHAGQIYQWLEDNGYTRL